jgi:hypothetical protein
MKSSHFLSLSSFFFRRRRCPFIATIFLNFTLNSFCTFFMLAMKSFTIFQLIEKILWLLLSSLAIFTLCYSTEASYKAINDFSTLFGTYCSHVDDDTRSTDNNNGIAKSINQSIKVLAELMRRERERNIQTFSTSFLDRAYSDENFDSEKFL